MTSVATLTPSEKLVSTVIYNAINTTPDVVTYSVINSTDDYSNDTTSFLNISDPAGNISELQTNITEIPVPPIAWEPWAAVLITIALCIIIVGTIVGNCLVCMSVGLVKRLQSPSNLLIVSLAVADLSVGMFVMPFRTIVELHGGAWVLGTLACDIYTTMDVLLCTSSILNLCAISIDRYFVITRPFQYAMKRTPKRMAMMVAIVWTMSAVVSIPPIFGWKTPPEPYKCQISNEIGYQIYATLCAFYAPLITMICIYFKIWLVSSKIAKAEAKTSKIGSFDKGAIPCPLGRPSQDSGDSNNTRPNGFPKEVANFGGDDDGSLEILPKKSEPDRSTRRRFTLRSLLPRQSKVNNQKESKATKTLGIIMGCFTLCWLPFFIFIIIVTFCGENCSPPDTLVSVLNWLGYCNSFLNPIIYARFNRDFRTPFKEILCCRCRGINTRMRSESYVYQYGPGGPLTSHRESLKPQTESIVRYNSQGSTVVTLGNGSANGSHGKDRETRI